MTDEPKAPGPFLRVEEAAKILGVPRSTLYEAIQRKDIPSVKIGRHLRLNRELVLSLGTGEVRGSRKGKSA